MVSIKWHLWGSILKKVFAITLLIKERSIDRNRVSRLPKGIANKTSYSKFNNFRNILLNTFTLSLEQPKKNLLLFVQEKLIPNHIKNYPYNDWKNVMKSKFLAVTIYKTNHISPQVITHTQHMIKSHSVYSGEQWKWIHRPILLWVLQNQNLLF